MCDVIAETIFTLFFNTLKKKNKKKQKKTKKNKKQKTVEKENFEKQHVFSRV